MFARKKKNIMKKEKVPLSKADRSEIWKSFWLHAILAFVLAFVFGLGNMITAKAGAMAENELLLVILIRVPFFLVWARFVSKIEKYKNSTGIKYPMTYIVLAIGSILGVIGFVVLFISLLIRLKNVPCEEQTTDQPV
jgi:hypothetical protein